MEAAKTFETLAKDGLESRLGQYSAKGFFFQAGLCILAAGDNVLAHKQIEFYKNSDFNFPASRECQLLDGIMKVRIRDIFCHDYKIAL